MKRIFFILLWTTIVCKGYAQDEVITSSNEIITKTMADSAYINNDFASAVMMYETILDKEGESADLYYNLGNSYYKMDNIAKAVLNYEKALLLNPGDGDIRFNLELAQSKTVDKVIPKSEMFFVLWAKSFTNAMSEKGWSKIGITAFIFTLISLLLYFFGKKIVWKKIGFITAICLFLVAVIANVCASTQKTEIMNHEYAIIMAPSITVKSTPNENGTDLFILHEGRKVMIKDDTMQGWKEIQLEDGNAGWVPIDVIEII
jgi:tetratricopeptide (TPR) repeat protein